MARMPRVPCARVWTWPRWRGLGAQRPFSPLPPQPPSTTHNPPPCSPRGRSLSSDETYLP